MSNGVLERNFSRGINLFGMKNSGKTTVGQIIAERYELPFKDTDDLIREETGRPLDDIIAADGIDKFLKIQRGVIVCTLREGVEIWAAGETVPKDPVLVEYMRKFGTNIFLHVDVKVLEARATDTDDAPAEHEEQLSLYKAAVGTDGLIVRVDREDQTAEEVARMIIDTCVTIGG